jgi:hypothetical protein
MHKFLGIMLLLNIVAVIYGFGPVGLMLTIALFGGVYYYLNSKENIRRDLPFKAGFFVVVIMAILAVRSKLGDPILVTMMATVEIIMFGIFGGGGRVDV